MNQTQEQIDYEKALQELNDLKKDAEKLNNPDDFAKYGKLRRVLAKKEKERRRLVRIQQVRLRSAEAARTLRQRVKREQHRQVIKK